MDNSKHRSSSVKTLHAFNILFIKKYDYEVSLVKDSEISLVKKQKSLMLFGKKCTETVIKDLNFII